MTESSNLRWLLDSQLVEYGRSSIKGESLMFHNRVRSHRRTRTAVWKMLAVSIFMAATKTSAGGIVWFDDFERFSSNSGSMPVSDDSARTAFTKFELPNDLTNTSIRTQLRVAEGFAGALIRWNSRQPVPNGYYGLIRGDGTARLGWVGGDWPVLRQTATGLDPINDDILLQLDAIGSRITLWMWADGDPFPEKPTLSVIDDTVAAGIVGLGGMSIEYPSRGSVDATFRYVQVANAHVPEPAASMLAAYPFAAVVLSRGRAACFAPSRGSVVGRPTANGRFH